jgi:hypothetical protein
LRKKIVQHWKVAVRANAPPLFEPHTTASGFHWIEPPTGHAWADPFGFEHEGKHWLFFEDYSYETMRGRIACVEISEDGKVRGAPLVCLENSHCHYSYPHVFRAGSEIFMIPESFESKSVSLPTFSQRMGARQCSHARQVRRHYIVAGRGFMVAGHDERRTCAGSGFSLALLFKLA